MDIDLATGLPELPEGLFWVVDWKRPDSRKCLRTEPQYGEMPKVLEVRICEPTVSSKVRTVPVTTPPSWRTLWMKRVSYVYETYTEHYMNTLESGGLYYQEIFTNQEYLVKFNQGWKHVIDRSKADSSRFFYAVKVMENTPENVLAVATEVYKKYQNRMKNMASKHEKALITQSLIGTYPPKKLETLNLKAENN